MKFILEERWILCEADDFEAALNSAGFTGTAETAENEPSLDSTGVNNTTANSDSTETTDDVTGAAKAAGIAVNDTTEDIPWGEYYGKCSTEEDFEGFWHGVKSSPNEAVKEGYYKSVWKNDGKLVEDLGVNFIKDLFKYGWTEAVNPFISLVRNWCAMPDPEKTSIMTKTNYDIVREAKDNNKLTKSELKPNSKLGKNNLVFNANLFKLPKDVILKYLTQQSLLRNNNTLPGVDLSDVLGYIMYKGDAFSVAKQNLTNKKLGAVPTTKELRPIDHVLELTTIVTGKTATNDEKRELDDTAATALINKIVNLGKDGINRAIKYIITKFTSFGKDYLTKGAHKADLKTIFNTTKLDLDATLELEKLLDTTNVKYTKEKLTALVNTLFEKLAG